MPYVNPIWLEGRRRYWQRHDAHRFRRPDGSEYKSYATRLIEQRQAEEEEARIAAEQEEMRETLLWLRRELAEVKFALAMRRIARKYDPNQPRVPKGNPDGGQWAKEGGGDAGKDDGLDTKPAAMLWKDRVQAIFGQKDLFTEVGGARIGGTGGAAPSLPPFKPNGPTAGVLRSAGRDDVQLISGRGGPASEMPIRGSGYDILNRTHVEGHAAATMRQEGISAGTLYINNPAICSRCVIGLPRMLPSGARLDVVLPSGVTHSFFGVP